MGNANSSCFGTTTNQRAGVSGSTAAQCLLRKRFAHGETVITTRIREASDSASASKALGAVLETLYSQQHGLIEPKSWIQLLNAQNHKGETALHIAASLGYVECVQYLLQQGANPWIQDKFGGHTPLHVACLRGQTYAVQVLLDELPTQWATKPDNPCVRYIECATISGFTPFLCAVGSRNLQTVKALLAHQPETQAVSRHNSWEYTMEYPAHTTALHIAAAKGTQDMVEFLLMRFYHSARRSYVDPRLIRNSLGELPWHVVNGASVQSMMAELLHPGFPLSVIFPSVDIIPSAQALASAALRQGLLSALDKAQQARQQALAKHVTADLRLNDSFGTSTTGIYTITSPTLDSSCSSAEPHTDLVVMCNTLPAVRREVQAYSPPCAENCLPEIDPYPTPGPVSAAGQRRVSMLKRVLSKQRSKRSMAVANDDDSDTTCNICLDKEAYLAVKPCSHKVCPDCARCMVQAMALKPIDCPFCRKHISGFIYSS